jgi:hypothetical protein
MKKLTRLPDRSKERRRTLDWTYRQSKKNWEKISPHPMAQDALNDWNPSWGDPFDTENFIYLVSSVLWFLSGENVERIPKEYKTFYDRATNLTMGTSGKFGWPQKRGDE